MEASMNCAACQAWLQDYLDGAAGDGRPAFDGHLRDCADCAGLYASARRLRGALPALAPPRPRPGLADEIITEYLREVRRRRRVRRAALAACALAAAVLVAVGVRLYAPATPAPAGPPSVAKQESPPVPPTAPAPGRRPVDAVPLRDAAAEAGSAVASLTSRAAGEAVGEARRLLPAVGTPTLDGLGLPAEPSARPLREAGEGVTAGLEPVTTSARRAVGLFLRDLPVDNEAKPGL
jgi:hypothetical protein